MKNLFPVLAIILVLASVMCVSQESVEHSLATPETTTTTVEPVPENAVILEDGTVISLELARTSTEQMLGLMYREGISENEGMLFVFEKNDYYKFWMKNVKFPIDMLWLDGEFRVVHIEKNVPPCTARPCPLYAPKKPARYVLEVKANLSEKRGIEEGDILNVKF